MPGRLWFTNTPDIKTGKALPVESIENSTSPCDSQGLFAEFALDYEGVYRVMNCNNQRYGLSPWLSPNHLTKPQHRNQPTFHDTLTTVSAGRFKRFGGTV